MKLAISVLTAVSLGLICTARADQYSDLTAKGYRWVNKKLGILGALGSCVTFIMTITIILLPTQRNLPPARRCWSTTDGPRLSRDTHQSRKDRIHEGHAAKS